LARIAWCRAVRWCPDNGRFPYARITGDPTKTIASEIGCALPQLGAGFLEGFVRER
jgi:hypothetical protein